jgi:hypothetical protein
MVIVYLEYPRKDSQFRPEPKEIELPKVPGIGETFRDRAVSQYSSHDFVDFKVKDVVYELKKDGSGLEKIIVRLEF